MAVTPLCIVALDPKAYRVREVMLNPLSVEFRLPIILNSHKIDGFYFSKNMTNAKLYESLQIDI